MEAVKILGCSREGLSGVRGRGTFRWWRRELERPSPDEASCGKAGEALSYNRCGAGKWVAAGRESEAVVVPVEPQDSTTAVREGPLLRSRASRRLLAGECRFCYG
jgi:hypothetical protein